MGHHSHGASERLARRPARVRLDRARGCLARLARGPRTDRQLDELAQQLPVVARLRTIPGIGPLASTALLAVWGDAHRFPSARHAASFLGLTPREHSSGEHRRLGAISKRGDVYLRTLLIHGARSVLWQAKKTSQPDRLRSWALRLEHNRGHNRAAVALANRLARIAWAVWTTQRDFQSQPPLLTH